MQVGLRSLPTPFQVQWLLKPNNTIHVQLNNQTVAFEANGEDAKGRLGLSCLPGSIGEQGAGVERQLSWGGAAWLSPHSPSSRRAGASSSLELGLKLPPSRLSFLWGLILSPQGEEGGMGHEPIL